VLLPYGEMQKSLVDEVPVGWILEMSWPTFVNRKCRDLTVWEIGPSESYERAWIEG